GGRGGGARRGRLQPGHAPFGLGGAPGGLVAEGVEPAAGVGVEREHRRRLGQQGVAQGQQDDVLEHVGVVAGMEGVAVVHRASLAARTMTECMGAPARRLPDSGFPCAVLGGLTLKRYLLAAGLALAAGAATAQSVEPVDLDMVARIRQEAFQNSQVMQTLREITEDVGPRLTASPSADKANAWAREKRAGWGMANVHDEPFDFGRGWEFSHSRVEMLAPRAAPLFALPKAWTPGTNGPVEGEAVAATLRSKADFEKYRGKLRGKIVFLSDAREYKPGTEPDWRRHDEASLNKLHE